MEGPPLAVGQLQIADRVSLYAPVTPYTRLSVTRCWRATVLRFLPSSAHRQHITVNPPRLDRTGQKAAIRMIDPHRAIVALPNALEVLASAETRILSARSLSVRAFAMPGTEGKDIGQKLMLAAGFLAAGLFVLVSLAANLKFGLSLAATPLDRIIYGALSLAADLMKVALPLVAVLLWRKQHRILAAVAALFCAGVICYSLAAAIGFAASTRGEAITTNKLAIDNRSGWEARIERTARQLDQLGVPRPAGVIQAEIDALLRTPGADGCTVINGPVTNEVCPKVDKLRKELAASQRAAELDASLVADRQRLEAVPVAASVADPQSATLSRLTALGGSAHPRHHRHSDRRARRDRQRARLDLHGAGEPASSCLAATRRA